MGNMVTKAITAVARCSPETLGQGQPAQGAHQVVQAPDGHDGEHGHHGDGPPARAIRSQLRRLITVAIR